MNVFLEDKKMKYLNLLIGFMTLFLLTSFCFAEEIIIFGNDKKSPKVWSEKGQPTGLLVDILRHLEPQLGSTFNIKLCPWKRAYYNMLEGEGGIIGLSKNDQRLKIIDYSDVMFVDEIILVVIKGNEFFYNTINDLQGKCVGVVRGSSYGSIFDKAEGTVFTATPDSGTVFRLLKLLHGRMDVALVNPGRAALDNAIMSDPHLKDNKSKFIVLENPFMYDPNYLGFTKTTNQKKFISRFNQALQKSKQSGAIQKIIQSYMK